MMRERLTVGLHHARQLLLASCQKTDVERINIRDALHRVLAEPVVTGKNIPPKPIATVQGYAVISEDISTASRQAPVELGILRDATDSGNMSLKPGCTLFVQAGNYLPQGADAVVDKEHFYREINSPVVSILRACESGERTLPAGSTATPGAVLLPKGTRLQPEHLRLLTLLGIGRVGVSAAPTVELFFSASTTDKNRILSLELWLDMCCQEMGAKLHRLSPVKPGRMPISRAILNLDSASNITIVLLDERQPSEPALQALKSNCKILFERVNTAPIGPCALGISGATPVLLCGSTTFEMALEMLLRPAAMQMLDCEMFGRTLTKAKASMSFKASQGTAAFVPGTVEYKQGDIWVRPVKAHSLWDYSTETADGFILVQEGSGRITRGDDVDFLLITR